MRLKRFMRPDHLRPWALDSKLRSANVILLAARSGPREFLNSGVS